MAFWRNAEELLSQLGLEDISIEDLDSSREAQGRLLSRLSSRIVERDVFLPGNVGFRTGPTDIRHLTFSRGRSRVVKFLARCSRELVLGVLDAVGTELASGGRIEVHLQNLELTTESRNEIEGIGEICAFLRDKRQLGGVVIMSGALPKVDSKLWEFIYDRSFIHVGWLAVDLLNCGDLQRFVELCGESVSLRNLRQMGEEGIWPQVVQPVSGTNVRILPEMVLRLLELTRGAKIEIVPAPFLPGLDGQAGAPGLEDYVAALMELYLDSRTPSRFVSPLSWVSERMDSEATLIGSSASAGSEIAVLPDGDLYASEYGVGLRPWHLGNVLKGGQNLRWERLDALPEALIYSQQPEQCRACVWRYRCGGLDASVFLLEERLHAVLGVACGPQPPQREGKNGEHKESGSPLLKSSTGEAGANGLWPDRSLAALYCEPRRRLFEEMLWDYVEAAAQKQPQQPRERIKLSDEGIQYSPLAERK
jgi:radical SAM protein with 4Fe4S-binding SPASM domain